MQFYQTNLIIKEAYNIEKNNFLHKICASNIENNLINYLFILNPQGKYVADLFYLPEQSFLISTANIFENLIPYIKYYDLLNQISFKDINLKVFYSSKIGIKDPRYLNNNILLSNDFYNSENEYYQQLRFNQKMAEFNDFQYEKDIILNFGYIKKFISNNKGCYPGQELMCYINNNGVIRKTVDICELNDKKIIRPLLEYQNKILAYKYI